MKVKHAELSELYTWIVTGKCSYKRADRGIVFYYCFEENKMSAMQSFVNKFRYPNDYVRALCYFNMDTIYVSNLIYGTKSVLEDSEMSLIAYLGHYSVSVGVEQNMVVFKIEDSKFCELLINYYTVCHLATAVTAKYDKYPLNRSDIIREAEKKFHAIELLIEKGMSCSSC